MPKRTLESLGAMVKGRRGDKKLRETAKLIGIGPATLMRVESGHMPDLTTFAKLCQWLEVDPGEFLGFQKNAQACEESNLVTLSAHFRANKTSQSQTVQALAQMINCALRLQPKSSA